VIGEGGSFVVSGLLRLDGDVQAVVRVVRPRRREPVPRVRLPPVQRARRLDVRPHRRRHLQVVEHARHGLGVDDALDRVARRVDDQRVAAVADARVGAPVVAGLLCGGKRRTGGAAEGEVGGEAEDRGDQDGGSGDPGPARAAGGRRRGGDVHGVIPDRSVMGRSQGGVSMQARAIA